MSDAAIELGPGAGCVVGATRVGPAAKGRCLPSLYQDARAGGRFHSTASPCGGRPSVPLRAPGGIFRPAGVLSGGPKRNGHGRRMEFGGPPTPDGGGRCEEKS